jgi:hypothetical protein
MMQRCLVLGALAVVACGGSGESSGGPRAPSVVNALDKKAAADDSEGKIIPVGQVPPEVAAITGRTLHNASRARMLKVKEPVKLKVLSGAELVNVVKKKVQTDIPKDQIKGEGHAYAALGLIPHGYAYEDETYAMLEEELAGLYIPEDKTMYVAKGISGDELETTLAHELVHALQDQHFGIGDKMKFKPGESDMIAAVHAMAEGDATSAMFDARIMSEVGEEALKFKNATNLIPDKDPEELLELELKNKKKPSKISTAPRFLAVGLLAPYADGMRFVHGMRRRGGPLGWKAVDQAWARPPATTEQLLHLDKYDANEPAIDVPVATGNALGTSFKKTYDEIFGEQEGRIAFAEWMDVKTSKKAAGGWGGDRVTLFEDGDKHAVTWRIVFDNVDEATEAFGHLALGWSRTYGVPSLQQGAADKADALQVWGALPNAPAPKKEDPKKDPPKQPKSGEKGALPPLPDAPDSPGITKVALKGCRALKHAGKAVTLLAGAPCNSIVAWSAEVGKAP